MSEPTSVPTRRLVCGVLLAGFAGTVVSACGSDTSTDSPDVAGAGDPDSTPTVAAGKPLVATKDVPVGGMALLAGTGIVVTQPAEGTFKAFSAICTHQGTVLDAQLKDGAIHCGKHGSEFSPEDGAVSHGPATRNLPEISVKVQGDQVVRA